MMDEFRDAKGHYAELRCPPEESPVDITALMRAEIEARDWDIDGDKRHPVDLPERRKGGWR